MPPFYQSATGYDPGGTLRQTTAGPGMGAPAAGMGGPVSLFADPYLRQAVGARAAEASAGRAAADDRANRALSLQEWEAGQQGSLRERALGDQEAAQAAAMEEAKLARRGRPVFTKTVGGMGVTPGTIRLNQWEPGAAFAGYEGDLGSGPSNSVLSTAGTQHQVASNALSAQDWNDFMRTSAQRQAVQYGGPTALYR